MERLKRKHEPAIKDHVGSHIIPWYDRNTFKGGKNGNFAWMISYNSQLKSYSLAGPLDIDKIHQLTDNMEFRERIKNDISMLKKLTLSQHIIYLMVKDGNEGMSIAIPFM